MSNPNDSWPSGPCLDQEEVNMGLRGPLLDRAVMAPELVDSQGEEMDLERSSEKSGIWHC